MRFRIIYEGNVFFPNGKEKTEDTIRCTNLTAKAFGVCSTIPLYAAIDVIQLLVDAGYIIINMTAWVRAKYKFKVDSPYVPWIWGVKNDRPKMSKFKLDYSKFKENMSLKTFCKNFSKGNYVISTKDHSMALKDGVLYDFSEKGFDNRRVLWAQQVFTKREFLKMKK